MLAPRTRSCRRRLIRNRLGRRSLLLFFLLVLINCTSHPDGNEPDADEHHGEAQGSFPVSANGPEQEAEKRPYAGNAEPGSGYFVAKTQLVPCGIHPGWDSITARGCGFVLCHVRLLSHRMRLITS